MTTLPKPARTIHKAMLAIQQREGVHGPSFQEIADELAEELPAMNRQLVGYYVGKLVKAHLVEVHPARQYGKYVAIPSDQ